MAGLRLKHIYKVYNGGVRAVNDFDLEIKDKSFVVLVGPSGCGKSTTLRMVAGLESITSGQLYIDNVLVNDVESKNRDIAMVFQSYALYPNMTVFQNMGFSLKLRHEKPKAIEEKVLKAAEILEISDLLDRKPKELSGGQRQRVALGRAIVREPNVFLLDEPLSNLDAKLRVQMRTEITKLHEKLQTTFIYVTHDQTEAMTMGDTIVVMNKGFVQQADAPVTLFEDPTNLFVATFLGSPQMNIIESVLVENSGKIGVKLENIDENIVWLRPETAKQIKNSGLDLSKPYLFGIRPDHISVADKGIPAKVEVVEQLGDETIIYCKIEGHAANIVLKAPLTIHIKSQDEIFLNFNNERVYLFDKDSEHSLIGMPSYNKIPCKVVDNAIEIGNESLQVDEEYMSHLLDRVHETKTFLAFKPEHVLLDDPKQVAFEELKDAVLGEEVSKEQVEEEQPEEKVIDFIERAALKVKIDFIEERTNYNTVYSLIDGENNYFVFRSSKDRELKVNQEIEIYLPLDKMLIFDENNDSLYSREVLFENRCEAVVSTNNKGEKEIKIKGGEKLVYPDLDVEDGDYDFVLKQDKCEIVLNKKLCKELGVPRMQAIKGQSLKVSCYDEEPQHKSNIIYAKINGFAEFITIVAENNFSVYKMPKFKINVPADGFKLIKK